MANKKAKGCRAKTRHKSKGEKLSIEQRLKELKEGSRVVVKMNGRYQKAMPFRRFIGYVGLVEKKVGRSAYMINFKKQGKKQIIGIEHLKILN